MSDGTGAAVEADRSSTRAGSSGPQIGMLSRARRKLAIEHPIDLNQNLDSMIFIAGTARSGTTWLLDLLNAHNDNRVIFEPLHARWGILTEQQLPRYVEEDEDDPELLAAVRAVLLGKFASTRWTGRYNTRHVSRRRIIKDVHSNLRLAWIARHFPGFPIVLVVRHPCAVVASRLRAGFEAPFDRDLGAFLDDEKLVDHHLGPFMDTLTKITSDFDREIARWCIETIVPLRQIARAADQSRIKVFFYEHLVADAETAIARLFRAVDRPAPNEARTAFSRFSKTTYREQPLASPAEALADWVKHVSPAELERALELLALFGLDRLYGPDPLPHGLDALMLYAGEPATTSRGA